MLVLGWSLSDLTFAAWFSCFHPVLVMDLVDWVCTTAFAGTFTAGSVLSVVLLRFVLSSSSQG